jgi:hypothetical protein
MPRVPRPRRRAQAQEGGQAVSLYRKKSVVIEAVQWTGENYNLIRDFVGDMRPIHQTGNKLAINTLEGLMEASLGDYIIMGVKGEFYPCKPDIFAATYEPVEAKP